MTRKRIILNFDAEYDILFVGFSNRIPSYGKSLSNGLTVFLSLIDDSVTGLEVEDYKKRITNHELFQEKLPFAKYLNSANAHNLVKEDRIINHTCYMD